MRAVLEASGASEIRVSRDEAERLKFWAGRKAAFPAAGRLSADYYRMDGTIPRKRLGECSRPSRAWTKYGLRCINVFHAGDGNMHPLILFDANVPANSIVPRNSAPISLSSRWRWAARSPESTGSGSREDQPDVQPVLGGRAHHLLQGQGGFRPDGLLNPGKAIPTSTAVPNMASCTSRTGSCPIRARALLSAVRCEQET